MSKNTTKGLLSKAWPDEVIEANQELSKVIADDTDNALTLEERTQAHKERMQVHEANKDDPDFLINQWSDAITAGAIRADAVTNAALVINKMEVDAITAHRNIASANLITADTIYKSITQTNYRLPTSLIKQIEEAVTTLGAKNKTQAAITLIEKGLLISGLSASSKGKIFKVLMSDYQNLSAEEINTITKITEGFKNEI